VTSERYVVLGLSRARAEWLARLAQWANSSSVPVELVKCVSPEEVRARTSSGRTFSAMIVDGSQPFVDRDFIDSAARAHCPVIVVQDKVRHRDWASLGATAALQERFDQSELMSVLRSHCAAVRSGAEVPLLEQQPVSAGQRGDLIAVCGPGGTGASTCAMALAQALASGPGVPAGSGAGTVSRAAEGAVLLADMKRRAELAMLHDAGDVVPGMGELVEAHRYGRLQPREAVGLTFLVAERGYYLMLGIHRSYAWGSLKPRALDAALDTLLEAFGAVVCDIDADFEGESDGGSIDVEERNAMSRTVAASARALFAVGSGGVKGVHALARVIRDLVDFGVDPSVTVPVVNRAPRNRRARSEIASALAALTEPGRPFLSPVFLPERSLEDAVRACTRLPSSLANPLRRSLEAVVARTPGARPHRTERVVPGSLGGRGLDDTAATARTGAML
jgi:hypothetical protein